MGIWNNLIDNVGDELALPDFKNGGANEKHTQRALNRTLQNMFTRHPFSWRVQETPLIIPAVVNQTDYNLSTVSGGVKFLDIFSVHVDDGSAAHPLTGKTLGWYVDHFANVAHVGAQIPCYYAKVGEYSIRVAPKPSSIAQILTIYYTLEIEDIITFTATIDIPIRAIEVVELGMLARMYRYLHESDRAGQAKLDYEFELGQLIKEDRNNPDLKFVLEPFRGGLTTSEWKVPFM